ncbi:MAG: 3D domain-containing protein [Cocleimonas sp.]|nr:3D domain-containing protein [Cocleimonas sp.]
MDADQKMIKWLLLMMTLINPSANADSTDQAFEYLSLNSQIISIHQQQDSEDREPSKFNGKKEAEQMLVWLNQPFDVINKLTTSPLKTLEVEATAYTSHAAQTDSTPTIAAWGDQLKPTTRSIAVSRDLLTKYGLKHRTKVMIKGLSGEFLVLDKMNKRWRKRIDIYMGMNRKAALKWGKKKVELSWKQEAV